MEGLHLGDQQAQVGHPAVHLARRGRRARPARGRGTSRVGPLPGARDPDHGQQRPPAKPPPAHTSADPSPITTSTGFQLATPHRLDALAEAGTVVVPGWCDPEVRPSAELVAALTAAHRAGARIVSLCTGAFVLADAGLLDGRRATTHWMYAERLRARCAARVDPAALYVQDGTAHSAGTAGITSVTWCAWTTGPTSPAAGG